MFKKDIKILKEKIIITVSTEKRKFVTEERKTFNPEEIKEMIPQELRGNVKLLSSPSHKISNFTSTNHLTTGQWIYEIQKTLAPPKKPQRRTRRKPVRKAK